MEVKCCQIEFDKEVFKERVEEYFRIFTEAEDRELTQDDICELWGDIKEQVLRKSDEGGAWAYHGVYTFKDEKTGFEF